MVGRNTKRLSMFFVAIVILLLTASLVTPVLAGEVRKGQRVTVAANEVIPDDLYCAGEHITVDGTIKGDLVAAGSEIRINGTVEGDVIAAGRAIVINGVVKDDARLAGMDVQLSEKGRVGDDVTVAAFSFTSRPESQIGGDLYVAAYQSQIDGTVAGNVLGAVNSLVIGGQISGNVTVEVGEPDPQFGQVAPLMRLSPIPILPSGITVSEAANIAGRLTYVSAGAGSISQKAGVGEIVRHTPTPIAKPVEAPKVREKQGLEWLVVWWFFEQLRRLVTLLFVALLLVWLAPKFLPQAAARLRERFWPSLGWGCLGEIVFVVGMVIAFVLIIALGLLLGLLTLGGLQGFFIISGLLVQALVLVAFVFTNVYITKLVVAFCLGVWLLEQARSKQSASRVWPVLIGIVLFAIVRAIPFVGGLIDFFVTLFGLGALWLWAREWLWPGAGQPLPSPAAAAVPPPVPPAQDQIPTSPESMSLEEAVTLPDIRFPGGAAVAAAAGETSPPPPAPESETDLLEEARTEDAGTGADVETIALEPPAVESPAEEREQEPPATVDEIVELSEADSPAEISSLAAEAPNGLEAEDEVTEDPKAGDKP